MKNCSLILLYFLLIVSHSLLCAQSVSVASIDSIFLSEILFYPSDGGSTYVEIFNQGASSIALSQLQFARKYGNKYIQKVPLGDSTQIINSGDYLAFTLDTSWVIEHYKSCSPDNLRPISLLPNLGKTRGNIALLFEDSIIVDFLQYSDSLHSSIIKDAQGIALERSSFSKSSAFPDRWISASSTSGFGTPGAPNSQYFTHYCENSNWQFSSTKITPNGDELDDELIISYQMNQPALYATIGVYDQKGNHIINILNNSILGISGSIVWNGLGNNRSFLSSGFYIILIEVHDTEKLVQKIKYPVALLH